MRQEELTRLSKIKVSAFSRDYLVYHYLFKKLNYAIAKYSKGKLLDIGCGNKPYESEFNGLISEYVGTDIIQSDQNKVDVLSPANKIPLEDNTFDTLFSTQTIEHVEDHQGLVNEAYRTLKSGGYFILSGPMFWPLHEEPYDFFRFTRYGFQYMLEKAGFEIVEILPCGGTFATSGQSLLLALTQSNNLNPTIRKIRSAFFKVTLINVILNYLFLFLDKVFYNDKNTMNYVIVAKK